MELTVPAKRSRFSEDACMSPASMRRLHRSAWNRTDVSRSGLERVIDAQALKIEDLENDLVALEEASKRNEWASRELERIMESNTKWKEHCDELQLQLRAEAKDRLKREYELQLKIAESEQQVTTLLHAQSGQQMELTTVKAELAKTQARLQGATLRRDNLQRLQNMHPVEASQELLSARSYLCTLQTQLQTTQDKMAGMQTKLLEAHLRNSKQEIEIDVHQRDQELLECKIRALECEAVEISVIKAELDSARQQVQMLNDRVSQSGEEEHLKEQLHVAQAAGQAQQIELEALTDERYQRIDWDLERDDLQAEIATLQHALNDLQNITGEKNVRHILCSYQTREVQSERKLQQLQTHVRQLEQDLESMRTEVTRVQAENNELARTADAARFREDTLTAGQVLLQAEVDFLNKRLELHMAAAASLSEQEIPAILKQERFDELQLALKEAKTAQGRLIQANQEMREDLQALHEAKVEAQQKLTVAQNALQEVQAKARHHSIGREKSFTERTVSISTSSRQDPEPDSPFTSVQKEYLEHRSEVLLIENESLRKEIRELQTKIQLVPDANTGKHTEALQKAELVIAKQTVEDYRTRVDKLGQFFVQNSEQFRTVIRDILGWNVRIVKQAGQSGSGTVTLCKGEDTKHELKISMQAGGYSLIEVPAWIQQAFKQSDVLEDYNSHCNLPRLLAGLLLGEGKVMDT